MVPGSSTCSSSPETIAGIDLDADPRVAISIVDGANP
jgi:hypothetical protein